MRSHTAPSHGPSATRLADAATVDAELIQGSEDGEEDFDAGEDFVDTFGAGDSLQGASVAEEEARRLYEDEWHSAAA